jgi:hypothetical protein
MPVSRRASVPILFLALLVAFPSLTRGAEIGPPARNLSTFRVDDAGYLALVWSADRTDMKERGDFPYAAPGKRKVIRQETYLSFAWLPHDRVEMDLRMGLQGMRVENALLVEGRTLDFASRYAGFLGGGLRVLAYDHPEAGFRVGIVADGSISPFRWKAQNARFLNATDNDVSSWLRYGEYMEARLALPVSKVVRFSPRLDMDTAAPRGTAAAGGIDWPFPEVSALEFYGGPFVRAAYMYGNVRVTSGTDDQGRRRFHLAQDSPAGFFAGVRVHMDRTHRWSVGLEGRFQSGVSAALLVDASL